jgi:hypothetical protein
MNVELPQLGATKGEDLSDAPAELGDILLCEVAPCKHLGLLARTDIFNVQPPQIWKMDKSIPLIISCQHRWNLQVFKLSEVLEHAEVGSGISVPVCWHEEESEFPQLLHVLQDFKHLTQLHWLIRHGDV